MKGKILNHFYDEKNAVTHLVKENKWGHASADVLAHLDDFDIANQYDGGYLAEFRCDMKLQKKKISTLKHRYHGMEEMFNALNQSLSAHGDDYALLKMQKQIKAMKIRIEKEERKYQNMKEKYPIIADMLVAERRKVRNGKKDKDC